jgi:hypothetical protein
LKAFPWYEKFEEGRMCYHWQISTWQTNYKSCTHFIFVFSQIFVSLFWRLFNDTTNFRAQYLLESWKLFLNTCLPSWILIFFVKYNNFIILYYFKLLNIFIFIVKLKWLKIY